MGFQVRFAPFVQEEIAGWNLPIPVVREFYLRVDDELSASSAPTRVQVTPTGMEHIVTIEESSGTYYSFRLFLTRSDMHFQVNDCKCVGIKGDTIFWSSG
jgi:hypothetical protein